MGVHGSASLGSDARSDAEVRSVLDSIRRIVRVLRVSDRAAETRLGLSGAQLFVLHKLAESPALSLNDLAERTRTDQSSVSVVVSRLVQRNLVSRTRSRKDMRQVELSLTPAGRQVLRRAPDAAQDRLIEALLQLSDRDRRQLASLLERVVHETGVDGVPAGMFFEDGKPRRPSPRRGQVGGGRTRGARAVG